MTDRPTSTAEANRRFYAETAEHYDVTEGCVVDPAEQEALRRCLDEALHARTADGPVLDACGGSGNVSLVLQEAGLVPTTVDVSPDMLAIYERKAAARGYATETVTAGIEEFFAADTRRWSLIVFSSALHHLEDYEGVARTAVQRLVPGGVLVTIFDPTQLSSLGVTLRRLDYLLHVARTNPSHLAARLASRLHTRPTGGADLGGQAERWALVGVDDRRLAAVFEEEGCLVVDHARTYEARSPVVRLLFRLARQPTRFRFVVRRPELRSSAEAS